jgi:hypothetical protein
MRTNIVYKIEKGNALKEKSHSKNRTAVNDCLPYRKILCIPASSGFLGANYFLVVSAAGAAAAVSTTAAAVSTTVAAAVSTATAVVSAAGVVSASLPPQATNPRIANANKSFFILFGLNF